MRQSLIEQITWLENSIEISRWELFRLQERTDDDAVLEPALDRLCGQIRTLTALREKASETSIRHLAKAVATRLMAMAKPGLEHAEKPTADEEDVNATRLN